MHPRLATPHTYDSATKKLTIRGAATFPVELYNIADDIEILDMSFGTLTTLPEDFHRLHQLKVVFLSHNNFTEVPESLATCPKLIMIGMKSCVISRMSPTALPSGLRALILTDNKLTELPSKIGELVHLQKLTLTGNNLSSLPRELLSCTKLELVRVAANNFHILPTWLLELPHLAWYSDAGNPGSMQLSESMQTTLSWNDVVIGKKLGESSKNAIYQGVVQQNKRNVAVKLYGSPLTADGYSIDEIRASLAIGTQENIIGAVGELTDAPNHQFGLVMELIPKEFHDLAQPPNFTTLTRDVYTKNQTFSPEFIVNILTGIASAMQHLHYNGVMHGDLYAHNILVNNDGNIYLGDFGAASLYPHESTLHEKVDIRAYAHLVNELVDHSDMTDHHAAKLHALQASLAHSTSRLPSFADIYASLQ